VRKIADKHGLSNVPLWNTETGWWIRNDHGRSTSEGIGGGWRLLRPQQALAFVPRALILGWASGLDRFYWYSWDHQAMGLIEPETGELKPAGVAYGRVADWMLGATLIQCELANGHWICSLAGVSGKMDRIAWCADASDQLLNVPSDWQIAEVETLTGPTRHYRSDEGGIRIGEAPILLRSKYSGFAP
jgi:hypothetical protein